jgi:hypothetical protein
MLYLLEACRHIVGVKNLPRGNQRGDSEEGVFEGRHSEGGFLNDGDIEIDFFFF